MLLDTHALLWYTLEPAQLSARVSRALKKATPDQVCVSSACFWEIALKVQRSQIDLGMDIQSFCNAVQRLGLSIVPVDARQWVDSVDLPWEHRDPVDRLLVALATMKRWRLFSKDQIIQNYYPATYW